jgi:hypothetical protein
MQCRQLNLTSALCNQQPASSVSSSCACRINACSMDHLFFDHGMVSNHTIVWQCHESRAQAIPWLDHHMGGLIRLLLQSGGRLVTAVACAGVWHVREAWSRHHEDVTRRVAANAQHNCFVTQSCSRCAAVPQWVRSHYAVKDLCVIAT